MKRRDHVLANELMTGCSTPSFAAGRRSRRGDRAGIERCITRAPWRSRPTGFGALRLLRAAHLREGDYRPRPHQLIDRCPCQKQKPGGDHDSNIGDEPNQDRMQRVAHANPNYRSLLLHRCALPLLSCNMRKKISFPKIPTRRTLSVTNVTSFVFIFFMSDMRNADTFDCVFAGLRNWRSGGTATRCRGLALRSRAALSSRPPKQRLVSRGSPDWLKMKNADAPALPRARQRRFCWGTTSRPKMMAELMREDRERTYRAHDGRRTREVPRGAWVLTTSKHTAAETHPTARELLQVYIGPPRLLSSQCRFSSSSLRTSDCHFDDPTRRKHRRWQR
jgi:hypothetical protein